MGVGGLAAKQLCDAFLDEWPRAVNRILDIGGGKIHRDFTPDGKARFHRFVRDNAVREDVAEVMLRALRYYFGVREHILLSSNQTVDN